MPILRARLDPCYPPLGNYKQSRANAEVTGPTTLGASRCRPDRDAPIIAQHFQCWALGQRGKHVRPGGTRSVRASLQDATLFALGMKTAAMNRWAIIELSLRDTVIRRCSFSTAVRQPGLMLGHQAGGEFAEG